MIRLPEAVYVATAPVNLHLSFDRLAGIVREVLGREPREEAVFVFHNRARTHLKILWHDGRGYCLVYNPLCSYYTSFDLRRGPWFWVDDAPIAAARSARRSQRLQCFAGRVGGSS